MYPRFGLTLTVTGACNLRCSYCYARTTPDSAMPREIGCTAIDRAVASLAPGGTLELGFFGGEPLLRADFVQAMMDYAQARTEAAGMALALSLTTNGTVTTPPAWAIMTRPDLSLAVSCDGLPETHDRHRRFANGDGSATTVVETIQRLVGAGKDFQVVMVVRPDTLDALPAGIRFLRELGVRHIDPSLDLWTQWTADDMAALERVVGCCAELWRAGLPDASIGWFDEKAAKLARVPTTPTARCSFGHGEVAVAPSGRLYPCERLIGDDAVDHPMAMSGHALDGDDFLRDSGAGQRCADACQACAMETMCNTFCRCSNYVRTGDVRRPDRLLCVWNQACLEATAKAMNG
ncbi:MAG: radical SAM protein [Phycisphaerae bacterium]|nr:radical SAM protein [Phycisphaerae bacterium]